MTDPATTTTTSSLPLAKGVWVLDSNHSGVHFKVRHIGLSNVRGRFNRFDATLTVGDGLDDTQVDATIDLASVDTNQPDRDAHLRSQDFFAADEDPNMVFRSTRIAGSEDEGYTLVGDLTINGVTNEVELDVEFHGAEIFPPDGLLHAGFEASATIKRSDFGIDFGLAIPGVSKVGLGDKISIDIDLQFVAPGEPTPAA
jgi:polyisoprenoid-binding protein YceI